MEDLYSFQFSEKSPMGMVPPPPSPAPNGHHPVITSDSVSSSKAILHQVEDKVVRDKVASHPLFHQLLHAHIDCQKVGAPPEIVQQLNGIIGDHSSGVYHIGDLELDNFMATYCNLLVNYKSDLSRPFDEATAFLDDMETQLNSMICNGHDKTGKNTGSYENDFSREAKEAIHCTRINEVEELKDNILCRYSGYISNLKHEFSRRKKKEKLPKEAKEILLIWWNFHLKWPYPTDADKLALAKWTGLDLKQVNNWFINQRKRHWKQTNEIQAKVLDGLLHGPMHE